MATPALSTMSPEAPVGRTRPGGVTYACALAIALGSLGVALGLVVTALSASFFGAMFGARSNPLALLGDALVALVAIFGLLWLATAVVGIVAGVQGLKGGVAWARWALIVLFALFGITTLATIVVPIANGVAIWFLANEEGAAWFDG